MTATFYLPRVYAVVGTAGLALFLLFAIQSFRLTSSFNLVGLFWLVLALASACFIAMYVRHRTSISSQSISQRTLLRHRTIPTEDVTCVRWYCDTLGGGVQLCSPGDSVTIQFDSVEKPLREKLTTTIRNGFPIQIQQDWDQFQSCCGRTTFRISTRDWLILSAVDLIALAACIATLWLFTDPFLRFVFILFPLAAVLFFRRMFFRKSNGGEAA